MLKGMIFLRRHPESSPEAFDQHLGETHAPLLAQVPGLRRLVVNRVQPDPNGATAAWEAIAEDWFDDLVALHTALVSPQGHAVNADAATFLDLSKLQFLLVQDEEIPLPVSA